MLLVGDSQSGKTSLVNRLLSDTFSAQYKATEGAFSKQHALTGSPIILQVCCEMTAYPLVSSRVHTSFTVLK